MSIEASSFVLGLSMGRGNGIRKLILLGYANHADKHGRGAYPSTQTIADYAECDVRTVQRHVGWLIAAGYLREGDQRMVDHLDPRYRPIVYDVAMKPEQIHQWASQAGPHNGNRTRAAQAGRRGGHASSQVSRGDNLSPLPEDESPQASRGDNLPPPETEARGDNNAGSGVTSPASRGDSPVTRTILEPSREGSSSPAVDAARGGVGLASNGGGAATPTAAALEVLPGSVRGHPSVIPTAVAARVRILVERGWPISEVGARMTGVETADAPGAAALARLDSLQELDPPPSRPPRPQWCGHCDQRTRMREDVDRDDRPYPCPACHSRPATTCGKAVERPG